MRFNLCSKGSWSPVLWSVPADGAAECGDSGGTTATGNTSQEDREKDMGGVEAGLEVTEAVVVVSGVDLAHNPIMKNSQIKGSMKN